MLWRNSGEIVCRRNLNQEKQLRGDERAQGMMFATVLLEDRIPATHPLRDLRRLVDPVLRELSPTFDALYSGTGRPSIPTEPLRRALLL